MFEKYITTAINPLIFAKDVVCKICCQILYIIVSVLFYIVCSVIACVTFVIVVKSYNCCHVVLSHFALPGGLEI